MTIRVHLRKLENGKTVRQTDRQTKNINTFQIFWKLLRSVCILFLMVIQSPPRFTNINESRTMKVL